MNSVTSSAPTATGLRMIKGAFACTINGRARFEIKLGARSDLRALGLVGMVERVRDELTMGEFHVLTAAGEAARAR